MDYEFNPRSRYNTVGSGHDLQGEVWRDNPLRFIILFYGFILLFLIFYRFLRATHEAASNSIWDSRNRRYDFRDFNHLGFVEGLPPSRGRGRCLGLVRPSRRRHWQQTRRMNQAVNQLSLEIVNEIIARNRAEANSSRPPEHDPPPDYDRSTTLPRGSESVPQAPNDPADLQELPPPPYESIVHTLNDLNNVQNDPKDDLKKEDN